MISAIYATKLDDVKGIDYNYLSSSLRYNYAPLPKKLDLSRQLSLVDNTYVHTLYPPHKSELVLVTIEPSRDEKILIDGYFISTRLPLKIYNQSYCNISSEDSMIELDIHLSSLSMFSNIVASKLLQYFNFLRKENNGHQEGEEASSCSYYYERGVVDEVITTFNLVYIVYDARDLLLSPKILTNIEKKRGGSTSILGDYTLTIHAPYVGILFFAKRDNFLT